MFLYIRLLGKTRGRMDDFSRERKYGFLFSVRALLSGHYTSAVWQPVGFVAELARIWPISEVDGRGVQVGFRHRRPKVERWNLRQDFARNGPLIDSGIANARASDILS